MRANLHRSCVLTVESIEFFLVGSASALGNDREAEQHVMVSDNGSYYPSTHTRCCVLLRSIVVFKKNLLGFYSAKS
jgi:hypothetical protein